ncbi:unnamed protein product [Nippostrongylus brasiliensis]|uniref:Intu_longin_1 domain-containing protein n=1 Tax=Nippostrongylus brasiliensis TaxID=27835 RepID=A0A0N4YKV9_NIPBR|nr:unnamed protein product [Nippostrongylus brasiliensis]
MIGDWTMLSGTFANPLYFFATNTSNVTQAEMWLSIPRAICFSSSLNFPDIMEFFFVAHPASGRREGEEHRRIMYFYPKGETLDRQAEITGFAEAVVNFTDNFVTAQEQVEKPEFPFRTVSTQKSEHVYIQVENCEFLIGLALSKIQYAAADYSVFLPAIRNVLTDVYKMFRLFFGEFSPFRKRNEQKFKERLEYFLGRYLPLLKLHRMPLLDYLNGAAFLPLNGATYLNVVSMTSELLEEFPLIEKILILYQDKVLYYSLSRRDLPSLFRYLTQSLLPMTIGDELDYQSRLVDASSNSWWASQCCRCNMVQVIEYSNVHGSYGEMGFQILPPLEVQQFVHGSHRFSPSQGRFLRGPQDLTTDAPLAGDDALPTVHLFNSCDDEENEGLAKYNMMVYRCLNATVCMFSTKEITRRLMRNIDGYLGSELSKVASQIGDCIGAQSPDVLSTPDFHYIYFNPASLSLTSSFTECPDTPKPALPPPEVNRLVCNSLTSFLPDTDEFGECFAKTESDWWIVLKKSVEENSVLQVNSRLLCLLLPPSSNQQSLADIQTKTLGIIKTHFEAIFLN